MGEMSAPQPLIEPGPDAAPLAWLAGEIRLATDAALAGLRRFLADKTEPDALRDALTVSLAGVAPQRAIAYCGSGVTACHLLLAFEHAGLPGARLYPGSWSEWSSDPARPVRTGAAP